MNSKPMQRNRSHLSFTRVSFGLVALLGITVGVAGAYSQEKPGTEHFPPMKEVLAGKDAGPEDPEARIRRLFGEVETNLKQVDLLLTDAAAGDTSALSKVEESGIAKLLQASLERGRQAQEDIRTIIEIAQQMGQRPPSQGPPSEGEGSSPGSPGANPSGSPLDRGPQSQSPESTPEAPGEESGGDKPNQQSDPQGEQDPSGQPDEKPGGQDPKSPEGDPNQDGQNRSGQEGSKDASGSTAGAEGDDGWGDLPAHVRDTFRSEGRSEMPTRYRDWIDQYYRKLNKRGPRR